RCEARGDHCGGDSRSVDYGLSERDHRGHRNNFGLVWLFFVDERIVLNDIVSVPNYSLKIHVHYLFKGKLTAFRQTDWHTIWRLLNEQINTVGSKALIKEGMFRIERFLQRFEPASYPLQSKLVANCKRL